MVNPWTVVFANSSQVFTAPECYSTAPQAALWAGKLYHPRISRVRACGEHVFRGMSSQGVPRCTMVVRRKYSERQLATYNALLAYEIDGNNPPDGRRVIRDERMTLSSPQNAERVAEAATVLKMWKEVS